MKHLVAPVLLATFSTLVLGFALSPKLVAGLLPGVIVSGLQFAGSASLSGEAWTEARKSAERGEVAEEDGRVNGVGSAVHRGMCIGSLVGVMIKKNASCCVCSALKLMGMLGVLFGSKFA